MLQPQKVPGVNGEWECMECGYVEEGSELQRPEKCPECNAGPESFEFFSYEEEEVEAEEEEWDDDLDDEDDLDDDLDDESDDDFDEDDEFSEDDFDFDDER